MTRSTLFRSMAMTAMLALAACGGGGGSGFNSTPPPPPPVSPPPPPPPPAQAPFGVTADTDFATVGDVEDFRWVESANAYEIRLTGQPLERLVETDSGSTTETHYPTSGSGYGITLSKEYTLSHTALAVIFENGWGTPIGTFGFGIPTAAGEVPITGTASYEARAVGLAPWAYQVQGTAQLSFDFGAGTLSGRFDPILIGWDGINVQLDRYDFVNTVFGAGSPTFSGQLSAASAPTLGSFDGMFTGPSAAELMANWQAPYRNPTTSAWETMRGVWIGSRGN